MTAFREPTLEELQSLLSLSDSLWCESRTHNVEVLLLVRTGDLVKSFTNPYGLGISDLQMEIERLVSRESLGGTIL